MELNIDDENKQQFKGMDNMKFFESTNVFDCIVDRLKLIGLNDPMTFIEKLIESKAFIAGSFVVQCLLNETYTGSDIDIYVHGNTCPFNAINKYIFTGCGFNCDVLKQFDSYLIHDILSTSINVTIDGHDHVTFNFIHVDTENCGSLEQFIFNSFDLSFCQTWFDGHDIYYRPQTMFKNGWIENKSILKYCRTVIPRFIMNPENHTFTQQTLDDRVLQRIEKYQSRGFTIYSDIDSCPNSTFLVLPSIII